MRNSATPLCSHSRAPCEAQLSNKPQVLAGCPRFCPKDPPGSQCPEWPARPPRMFRDRRCLEGSPSAPEQTDSPDDRSPLRIPVVNLWVWATFSEFTSTTTYTVSWVNSHQTFFPFLSNPTISNLVIHSF